MPPWEDTGAGQSRGSADKQGRRLQKARREAGARTVGDANQDYPKHQASKHCRGDQQERGGSSTEPP